MNKMKIGYSLAFTFICSFSFAQFIMPKQDKAIELQKRKIMVELISPNESVLKEVKKDTEAQKKYKEWIEQTNTTIQESFEKFWTVNDDISFAQTSDIESIMSDKNAQYAVFRMNYGTKNMRTPSGMRKRQGYLLSLYLADQKKPVFEIMTPSMFLSSNDYKFVLLTMNQYLKAASEGKSSNDLWSTDENLATIKNKPLLITKEQTELSKGDIAKHYSSTVRFTDQTDLEEQIAEGRDILFTTTLFHMRKGIWMNATVDASTMSIVGLVPAESLEISLVAMINERDGILLPMYRSDMQLDKKYFKYTASKLAMKANH